MVVGSAQLIKRLPHISLFMLGKTISPVSYAKDLGACIDRYLPCNVHIPKTASSCMNQLLQISRIKTLRSDRSTGADQIPTTFIKLAADHLVGPLTRIINGCITEVYFPKLWKIARVSPIPKVDNPSTNDIIFEGSGLQKKFC